MKKNRILITGATGNVGAEVVRSIVKTEPQTEIILAVRNPESAKKKFLDLEHLLFRTIRFFRFQHF
ncbi:MAG: hypothetical protein GQ574_29170 [Crocinitomix sp.]|nr:hypothetical protein [Crocinitomix sp.]